MSLAIYHNTENIEDCSNEVLIAAHAELLAAMDNLNKASLKRDKNHRRKMSDNAARNEGARRFNLMMKAQPIALELKKRGINTKLVI